MSEEMNRREVERNVTPQLSDAELENVSGALSRDEVNDIRHWADGICDECIRRANNHCNGGSYGALVAYLKANGKYSVSSYRYCPYYKP